MDLKKIILATINAKYYHTSLALKYLKANSFEFESDTTICEFSSSQSTVEIAKKLLENSPDLLALGVYIWNKTKIIELLHIIHDQSPQTLIVLGGPEVSYEIDPIILDLCDYVLQGEAEITYYQLLKNLESSTPPQNKIITEIKPDLTKLRLPYYLYDDSELETRFVMIESSRGCPYGCEFCLSSLEPKVRFFDIEQIVLEIKKLLQKRAKKFKFIDRTFNLLESHVSSILNTFLEDKHPDLFLHFEITPLNIRSSLTEMLKKFPQGMVQLEIGIQTLTPEVLARITRNDRPNLVLDNLKLLINTGALIHADLIFGLPGENIEEMKAGFNRLYEMKPNEIQVGILKKLPGAPIKRHDDNFKMCYQLRPPYEIISNSTVSESQMNELKRFAKFFELIVNRKQFEKTLNLIFTSSDPFDDFFKLSRYLDNKFKRDHSISLDQLYTAIYEYLTDHLGLCTKECIKTMKDDYLLKPRKYLPAFLKQES